MAKSSQYTRSKHLLGVSVGNYVHGTGGGAKWWASYDAAKAHFDVYGNLDEFSDRAWMKQVRQQRKRQNLTEDQYHFLKQINFDFSEQKKTSQRMGAKLQRTFELREKFNQGAEALTAGERAELLNNLKSYRAAYNGGKGISEKSAQKLGVDYDGDSVVVCNQLKASIKESENAISDDFPLNL